MKRLYLSFLITLYSVLLLAQEGGGGGGTKKIDVNVNTGGGGNWYTSPWLWVVGAAVFILL
ncbi:MAG: hypothetical protein ICV84_17715, partial [Flavisolibacter sp.]|nr:hypothetical protein [Flavisolibacter sp.]